MPLHHHKLLRQRDGYLPVSGSVVESDPTPTASSLAQNSAAVVNPSLTEAGIPLVTSPVSSSTTSQSSTPTTTASASSGSQISLGTTIAACVAAVIALLLAALLAIYCSRRQKQATARAKSRNVARNESRKRSHLGPWKQMNDGADSQKGQEQAMTQRRPPSGPIGAMFQRTLSSTSGDKSYETHNRESVGTMQHFAKYHSGLAAEMASQSTVTDGKVTKPLPVLHLAGRGSDMTPPVSWDGERKSSMSPHSAASSSPSPFVMAMEKSTPSPTTAFSLHQWESAEVVHVGQTNSVLSEDGELRNPFADSTSSFRSSIRGENPFFGGRNHPVRRTLQKNPFTDPVPPHDSSIAIQSLIAALQEPVGQDDNDRIVSIQSSVYSRMTADDGDSAISVTAFPYPPTHVR